LRAAAELTRISLFGAPIGLIFAFASDIGMDHHIPRLLLEQTAEIGYQPNQGQTPCPIQGVCILGRGSWFLTENNSVPGWYEVTAEQDRELLAFVSIVSNAMFGNKRGLGTHVLDCSWLIGP